MRKIIIGLLLLLSVGASAQWQQTGSKVRYVNGLGIPTKDTAAGVAADSSQILIRPADSSLYIKYKRTWVKVGSGGGGTVTGSGTTNYIPKFTSSTAIGNSQIFDNGTLVLIGTTSTSGVDKVRINNDGASVYSSLNLTNANSTANMFVGVGGSTVANTPLRNNAYVMNKSASGLAFGTNDLTRMFITSAGNVGINQTSPIYQLHVTSGGSAVVFTDAGSAAVIAGTNPNATVSSLLSLRGDILTMTGAGINGAEHARINGSGRMLLGTTTDNGVDRLQVSGSMNVSARATAQNLSVTNNISVTNDINQGSGTADAFYTILANSTSSGWAGRFGSRFATGAFEFQHRNNSPTFVTLATFDSPGGDGLFSVFDQLRVVDRVPSSGKGKVLINTSSDNGVDKLQVEGSISGIGMKQAYVTKTGAYTATNADYVIDCTSGTFTVTLPASSGRTGRILIIKNSGAGTITVDGNASETIDGAATYSLATQYATVQIMSDGTNWKIIAKF